MGKSGLIGKKIAATLASTGTPAFFLHPAEASHGDLGMVTSRDVIMAISNSGETDEIIDLIPFLKRFNVSVVSMTGNPDSTLARTADVNIDISVMEEACPLGITRLLQRPQRSQWETLLPLPFWSRGDSGRRTLHRFIRQEVSARSSLSGSKT